MSNRKKPVTFTLPPELIHHLDKKSHEAWMTRSSYVAMVLGKMMEDEKTSNVEGEVK